MHTGALKAAIAQYKFNNVRGWASILGRVLAGYLDANEVTFAEFDIITASPTFLGAGARRTWDHVRGILDSAAQEALFNWPFDFETPPIIVKTRETTSMTGQTLVRRREIAQNEIRAALSVPDPAKVQGKKVLMFDDVFTDGSTLEEVARALRYSGASTVSQVVLARAPWQS